MRLLGEGLLLSEGHDGEFAQDMFGDCSGAEGEDGK